jgi:hypothetical protein
MMNEGATLQNLGENEWNEVRLAFFNSLMVDTPISSLAQNLEFEAGWPIEGDNEVPSKYIGLSWEEVNRMPELAGQPLRIGLLITILRETMAFDDPFGEMIETVEKASEGKQDLKQTLSELGIPMDLPLEVCAISPDILEFCSGEGVTTIGDFATFSERLAQNGLLLGGDIQGLLNALILRDEPTIARYLPFRPQSEGIHFVEAMGMLVGKLNDPARDSLLKRYGARPIGDKLLDRDRVDMLEFQLVRKIHRITDFCGSEMEELCERISMGRSAESCFMRLNDESKEVICAGLLRRLLHSQNRSLGEGDPSKRRKKRRSFFSRLFQRA